ncbi:DUF2267 domain-containing protein [Streptomyces sp. NPDC058467]|uniref:DUF2267 domain-containing protein n=1 Tax=Streptomyces sp. NPDC058467 TaxID=3346513 RepID=UPI00365771F8
MVKALRANPPDEYGNRDGVARSVFDTVLAGEALRTTVHGGVKLWGSWSPPSVREHGPGRRGTLAGGPRRSSQHSSEGVRRIDEKQFVRTVAERTALSRQEAADLTWATLETLTHRMSPGEGRDLITELPEGLAEAVRRGTTDLIERFGHHDSVRRVAERTMLKEEEADRGVRTVLAVLREAISEKEFNDLMSQLGTDFSQVLESAG